ncbi:MAG: class I SAM-dependent methyltransferase [Woeseiaceae bacterium]|nr:class I SAM-dependent methyltransferase [Woeseiaceae bacterium]
MSADASFKDYFSDRSSLYARYRPGYPQALFGELAALCRRHDLAWDCATGNGQAAVAIADHFKQVIATDASAEQIASAIEADAVDYRVAHAESSGLDTASVDLVTVGQALHWFDRPRFFAEVERVLAAGGVLAAWCYELCHVDAACDAIVAELYDNIVGEFWPPERRLIEEGYASIELPGEALRVGEFAMSANWTAADMLGYLRTWSACERYEKHYGEDPVERTAGRLQAACSRPATCSTGSSP